MSFALSTSWNAFKFSRGLKIIEEIKDLGFEEIELSFSLDSKIIKDISSSVKKKKIRVVSLHNFCPIPKGFTRETALPDCYSLASTDEQQRKKAVYFTKKSIDCCVELKARALVLHSGRVQMQDDTRFLMTLYSQGLKNSQQYKVLKARIQKQREERAEAYLAQIIKSLEELSRYSQKLDIALGIENRIYFGEIPSFDEIAIILKHFSKRDVFYWHDTGHAQIMENLGFVNSGYDFLERYGSRLRGIHLHDVKGCMDHLAPLKGDLDFSKLKSYINDSTLKVIESHYPATPEEIIAGRSYLEKVLG